MKYERLKFRDIRVEGWYRELLERYSKGLLGSLEDIWPSVGKDNAWIGGSGDSWERGPYYLDGLACFAKANDSVQLVLSSQAAQEGVFFLDLDGEYDELNKKVVKFETKINYLSTTL